MHGEPVARCRSLPLTNPGAVPVTVPVIPAGTLAPVGAQLPEPIAEAPAVSEAMFIDPTNTLLRATRSASAWLMVRNVLFVTPAMQVLLIK